MNYQLERKDYGMPMFRWFNRWTHVGDNMSFEQVLERMRDDQSSKDYTLIQKKGSTRFLFVKMPDEERIRMIRNHSIWHPLPGLEEFIEYRVTPRVCDN